MIILRNLRNKIADKLVDSAGKDYRKLQSLSYASYPNLSKTTRKNLYKKSGEMRTKVVGSDAKPLIEDNKGSVTYTADQLRKGRLEDVYDFLPHLFPGRKGRFARDFKKGRHDYYVFHKNKNGDAQLAHELGHVRNLRNGGILSRLSDWTIPAKKLGGREALTKQSNSIKEAAQKFIARKRLLLDENLANRSALKILKEVKASPEELKIAKNFYKKGDGISSYRLNDRIATKLDLANLIRPIEEAKIEYI